MLKAFFSNPFLYINATFAGLFWLATPYPFLKKLRFFLLLLIFGLFAWPFIYFTNKPKSLMENLFDKIYLYLGGLAGLVALIGNSLLLFCFFQSMACNLHIPSDLCNSKQPNTLSGVAVMGAYLFAFIGLPALLVYTMLSVTHFFRRLKRFQSEN